MIHFVPLLIEMQRSMGPRAGPTRPSDWERSRAATSRGASAALFTIGGGRRGLT